MANDKRRGTVKLSQYNEQAQVAPSATRDRSIVVGFYNAEGTAPVHPGCFTPAEADAFIAAITAALGRPAPDSTPLEARLLAAIEAADEHAEQGWSLGVEAADLAAAKGRAEGLRAALAMAREAGPTVPRVAVADVVPLLAGVSTILADSDDTEAKREAVRRLDRIIVALGRMVTDGPTPTEGR